MRTPVIWFFASLLASACNQPAQDAAPSPAPALAAAVAQPTPPTPPASTAPPPSAAQPATVAAVAAKPTQGATEVTELRVSAHANAMLFEPRELKVRAGQTVHLVLENKLPGVLPHNWALVNVGTEASVAAAGLKKGAAAGYLDPVADVLAHTDMAAPGATIEVTFQAPASAGKYPYICTFPGHYMMMKGVLEVVL